MQHNLNRTSSETTANFQKCVQYKSGSFVLFFTCSSFDLFETKGVSGWKYFDSYATFQRRCIVVNLAHRANASDFGFCLRSWARLCSAG